MKIKENIDMTVSGAIFDMDGTLLDSMCVWDGLSLEYARTVGITPKPDFKHTVESMTFEALPDYLEAHYGKRMSKQEIIFGFSTLAKVRYDSQVSPKPGVYEFLDKLQSRGVKMCVATMTEHYLAKPVLERFGLLKYFSGIFTCTMVDAGKDKPDVYEAALRHLGTPKGETPVFEDALYAVRTVKAAGFPAVGVYDSFFAKQRSKIEGLADAFIEDYRTQTLL